MKHLGFLVVLAACELQPAPKQQAQPPGPPPAAQTEAPAAKPVEAPPTPTPPQAGSGSGLPTPPKIEISAACMEVAAKLAQVFIDAQTDPAQKSIAEQARADMTRKMGEACTVQPWTEAARACFLAAKSEPDIRACEKKFPAPQPPPRPQPPAGALQ